MTCFNVLQFKFGCRQFWWEFCPCWNLEYWKYTVVRSFLWHALTYWAEILHMTLFYCTSDQVWVSISKIFVGVMPLLSLRILEIHSFHRFPPTFLDILNWNFSYDFVLMYYRSSSIVITLSVWLSFRPSIFLLFSSTYIDQIKIKFKIWHLFQINVKF